MLHPNDSGRLSAALQLRGSQLAGDRQRVPDDASEEATRRRRGLLRCADCGTAICRQEDRCEAAGAHHHRRTNPHGLTFEFGCFGQADVVLLGPLSARDSWFPAYRWQIAVCPNCRAHLGWRFRAEDASSFYALITDRLRATD